MNIMDDHQYYYNSKYYNLMMNKKKKIIGNNSNWEKEAFFDHQDHALIFGSGGGGRGVDQDVWPPRSYSCGFCTRQFRSAQALGGHMNVHRRDRARLIKHHQDDDQIINQDHEQTDCTSGGRGGGCQDDHDHDHNGCRKRVKVMSTGHDNVIIPTIFPFFVQPTSACSSNSRISCVDHSTTTTTAIRVAQDHLDLELRLATP